MSDQDTQVLHLSLALAGGTSCTKIIAEGVLHVWTWGSLCLGFAIKRGECADVILRPLSGLFGFFLIFEVLEIHSNITAVFHRNFEARKRKM